MSISVFKTFLAGEVLTASDLNSSFSQIVDNGEDVGWPRTKAADLNGQEFITDADGDSSITCDTDDRFDFKVGGTDLMRLKDAGTATGIEIEMDADFDSGIRCGADDVMTIELQAFDSFIFDGDVASPVNGITFTTTATGVGPSIAPHGETNIDLNVSPKGSGELYLNGVIHKSVVATTTTAQTAISDTEVDLTSFTGITLPTTTSVSTKTFRISGSFYIQETLSTAELITITLYNGSTGDKGDTAVASWAFTVPALFYYTLPIEYTFTPGADTRTKIGFSAVTGTTADIDFQPDSTPSTIVITEIDT